LRDIILIGDASDAEFLEATSFDVCRSEYILMYVDQSIFDTLRALVEWDGWDELVLLSSAEMWYPMLAPRIGVPIISLLPH
jgi:hypothetical protein